MRKNCSWLFMTCSGFGTVKNPEFAYATAKGHDAEVACKFPGSHQVLTGHWLSTQYWGHEKIYHVADTRVQGKQTWRYESTMKGSGATNHQEQLLEMAQWPENYVFLPRCLSPSSSHHSSRLNPDPSLLFRVLLQSSEGAQETLSLNVFKPGCIWP